MPTARERHTTPSPEIFPVLSYLTPNQDLMFYVLRDSRLAVNQNFTYGTKYKNHPGYARDFGYGDHELCYVAPADESGWQKWYYVADRSNQDLYNWEWTSLDLGGVAYHAVRRTYVIPRDEFAESAVDFWSEMPDVPAETFDGVYILARRDESRIGVQELDALFVLDVRTYAKIPQVAGQDWDYRFGVAMPYTQDIINTGDSGSDGIDGADVRPLTPYSSVKRTMDIAAIQAALAAVDLSWATTRNVNLPNVVSNIRVLATRVLNNGVGLGGGSSARFSTSSAISVTADVAYDLEEGYSGPVPATIRTFFVRQDEYNAESSTWPRYAPKGIQYVLSTCGLSKEYTTSASDGSWAASEGGTAHAGSVNGYIPASLHSAATIDIVYHDVEAPTGAVETASDRMLAAITAQGDRIQAAIDAGLMVYGIDCSNATGAAQAQSILDAALEPWDFATDLTTDDATVRIEPTTVAATNYTDIQYGDFLVDSSVELYGYGMLKVTTVTVHLTDQGNGSI